MAQTFLAVSDSSSNTEYFFKADVNRYNAEIRTACGLSLVIPPQGKPAHRISDLLGAGVLIKLKVTCGTTIAPRIVTLFCARHAVKQAISSGTEGLIGKTIPGVPGVVRKARIPRKTTSI